MAIRAIVFDIGGVLEITPDLGVAASWEQRLQLPDGEIGHRLGDIWEAGAIGTISEEDVNTSLRERLGISAAQVEALTEDVWNEYLGTRNDELFEYFRNLRPRYQTALLSNSFVGARQREEQRYKFSTLCDDIVYSHEVGMLKPDARIYALTCERLGRKPEQVVFLDDLEANVVGAQEAGMHAVLFKDNTQAIADIQACIATHVD